MVNFGNKLFHYRNFIFPIFYLLLFIPSPHIFESNKFPIILGFIVALSGQLIRIVTIGLVYIIRGGRNRMIYAEGLITDGIFSHCRNPLYVGNVLMIMGLGIMSNSIFFNLLMTPLFIFFYQAIILAEENFLRNKFGSGYDVYTSKVNRWIPDLNGIGKTMHSMTFNWMRVMIKEYNTTFIWLTGALLVVMMHYYEKRGLAAFQQKLFLFLAIELTFLGGYLFVRYMKKSGKWTDHKQEPEKINT